MSDEKSDLAQAPELIDVLNRFLERLGDGQLRIINDFEVRLEQATQRGTSAGMAEAASTVAELLSYVRDGSLRQSIVDPIRAQSASALTEMAKASTADTRAAIIDLRDEARRVLSRVVPKVAVPWLLVGVLAMLTVATVALVLGVKAVSGTTYDEGFLAGASDRMLRERAFYEGLDRSDQADLDRHNAHLDRSMRLNFSGQSGR